MVVDFFAISLVANLKMILGKIIFQLIYYELRWKK